MRYSYGSHPLQFGDLRVPAGAEPHPLVIVIHGGFWRNMYTLDLMTAMCESLQADGIATWNIEYRRVGDEGGGYPGTFQDVALAADYVRELAKTNPLDLTRVISIGHSAGGHLAVWLAARPKIPSGDPLHTPSPLPLRAAISQAGALDLRRSWEMNLGSGAAVALMGASPDEFPDRYATASPAAMLPLGVRQVLLHGAADDRVPYEISKNYQAAAVARGDDVQLVTLPGAGHFEVIDPKSREWMKVREAVLKAIGI